MRVVMDNAPNGTTVDTHLCSKVVCFWVRSGTADLIHDGDVICSIVVGDREVCDGLHIGAAVRFAATSDSTTLVIDPG